MYGIVKIAALSAALAAALVTALDAGPSPTAADFLTRRLEIQVSPKVQASPTASDGAVGSRPGAGPALQACAARAWPYGDECAAGPAGITRRDVRVIGLDRLPQVQPSASRPLLAQR